MSKTISYPTRDYIVFDFETTGFSATENDVIQLSAIKYQHGMKTSYNAFVKGIEVPAIITELTGITGELLNEKGVSKEEAWKGFSDFIGYALPLIGHNIVNFDRKFLDNNFIDMNLAPVDAKRYIDTAMIYKGQKLKESQLFSENHYDFCVRVGEIRAYGVKYKLTLCCEELGIDISQFTAHQSDSDVEMTNLIYLEFVKES